jgi:hypothetical protein
MERNLIVVTARRKCLYYLYRTSEAVLSDATKSVVDFDGACEIETPEVISLSTTFGAPLNHHLPAKNRALGHLFYGSYRRQ